MSETSKAHGRRESEGWYKRYVKAPGIDIGAGTDPLPVDGFYKWDNYPHPCNNFKPDGDAQLMEGVPDEKYETVYASHILEHMRDPQEALRNWFRILKPGGHLIVCVPHRDLYEKRERKPSVWNPHTREGGGGHLWFFLPDLDANEDTMSFRRVLEDSLIGGKIVDFRVVDAGYNRSLPVDVHPVGEYAIEAVILKPL